MQDLQSGYLELNKNLICVTIGDIEVGNVSGRRESVPDPQGRVGMSVTREHFTELNAPNGKLVTGNIRDTDFNEPVFKSTEFFAPPWRVFGV